MRTKFILINLLIFLSCVFIAGSKKVYSNQDTISYIIPGPNDIDIDSHAICVPLGKIILIKSANKYGAIKFNKSWTKRSSFFNKNAYDVFALYDSYYQEDGTGNFNKKNVIIFKGKTSSKYRVSLLYFHPYEAGNPFVRCGPLEISWSAGTIGLNYLYFYRKFYFRDSTRDMWEAKTDYGLEFAPTKWNNVSEINIFDSRLKWYKYDENRKDIIFPIDKLWEEKEQKQESKRDINPPKK